MRATKQSHNQIRFILKRIFLGHPEKLPALTGNFRDRAFHCNLFYFPPLLPFPIKKDFHFNRLSKMPFSEKRSF
ncbi:hypothetical protein OA84_07460 [Kaistella solincola]|uniref:Uncharacterized protein n=1 Tax=Kaistella solincola TaxID=510955 RepID=A0ABR4ZQH5_9FLAO|nr:hypothetical protein OA84_07460 [Kaistella solincola]